MKGSKALVIFMTLVLATLISTSFSICHGAVGIPVSVTNVSVVPEPVCEEDNTGSVDVSADISVTFDSSTIDSTQGRCDKTRCAGETTGGGSCSTRTDSTTHITVTPSLIVTASEGTNTATLTGSYPGTFTGSLDTTTSPDGKKAVTVDAVASESISTQTDTVTYGWGSVSSPNTNCVGSGTQTGSSTGTPSTTSKSGDDSAEGSYRVDLVGPTITVVTGVQNIQQGQGLSIGLNADGASSGAAYTATFTATNGSTLGPFTETGYFKDNKDGSGVQNNEHIGPVSLSTNCNTPVGTYTLTAKLDSADLCGDEVYSTSDDSKTFQVTPGLELESQTLVISEFPSGEYGIDECFLSTQANKKINNEPGYVHIASVVTSSGPCSELMDLKGVTMTLTLPSGFAYSAPGKSPAAHVFVFPAMTGFDYHYPPNEVTSLVNQSRAGQTITIDLSTLNVGYGVGTIPTSWTIYARAKAAYSGTTAAGPNANSVFSSSADAAEGLSADSSYTLVSNPNEGCVDGNFPEP